MSDRMFAACCYGTERQHPEWERCPFEVLREIRLFLPNVAQLIDTIKMEWQPTGDWSEWDASVRADLTKHMLAIDAALSSDTQRGRP